MSRRIISSRCRSQSWRDALSPARTAQPHNTLPSSTVPSRASFSTGEIRLARHVDKDTVIVGMVEDVAIPPGLEATAPLADEEEMYIPATQVEARALALLHIWFQPSWIVRTGGPVEGLTAQMQRALASVDPNLPFSGFYRMKDLLAKTLAIQRVEVALLSTMATLALLLSTVGIFALVANIVAQRTREIGIRIALGSTIRKPC